MGGNSGAIDSASRDAYNVVNDLPRPLAKARSGVMLIPALHWTAGFFIWGNEQCRSVLPRYLSRDPCE